MKNILKIFFIFNLIWTRSILPINNFEIEKLEIGKAKREYVVLRNNEAIYEIKGPKLVSLYFRKPIPKKKNQSFINVSLKIKLNETKYIMHNENYHHSKYTKSNKHPAHRYSQSGKIQIKIPKGLHRLFVKTEEKPLLIRLKANKKLKRFKSDIIVDDLNNNLKVEVSTGKKSYQYSKISPEKSVEYLINEKGTLWIYTRAIHDFDNSKLYPFILEYNDLVDKKLCHLRNLLENFVLFHSQ